MEHSESSCLEHDTSGGGDLIGFDYPLLLDPIAVPRPWGAGRLCNFYDRQCVVAEQPVGESWDISTWPTDPGNIGLATVSVVTNGSLAGTHLDRIANVPVVVKLLDAADKLSVQVHPVRHAEHKDEMWYILHAEPDAYLYCGLADGVSKLEFCEAVSEHGAKQQRVLDMLRKVEGLKPGDYFNVPSGTVHAVGPGLIAFEVSERTQVTYRLFDYNRGRALHIEEGCEAVMAQRSGEPLLDPAIRVEDATVVEMLSAFPTFCVLRVMGERVSVISACRAHLITATRADMRITGDAPGWDIKLRRSYTCLVPATDKPYLIETFEGGEAIVTTLSS